MKSDLDLDQDPYNCHLCVKRLSSQFPGMSHQCWIWSLHTGPWPTSESMHCRISWASAFAAVHSKNPKMMTRAGLQDHVIQAVKIPLSPENKTAISLLHWRTPLASTVPKATSQTLIWILASWWVSWQVRESQIQPLKIQQPPTLEVKGNGLGTRSACCRCWPQHKLSPGCRGECPHFSTDCNKLETSGGHCPHLGKWSSNTSNVPPHQSPLCISIRPDLENGFFRWKCKH